MIDIAHGRVVMYGYCLRTTYYEVFMVAIETSNTSAVVRKSTASEN